MTSSPSILLKFTWAPSDRCIRMAMRLRFQPHISVRMAFGNPYLLLSITMSVFSWFSSGLDSESAFLNTHIFSATLKGILNLVSMPEIQLYSIIFFWSRWEICQTIHITSDWIPFKLTVSFWNHSSWGGTNLIKIDVKEATFCGILKVNQQAFLCCNLNWSITLILHPHKRSVKTEQVHKLYQTEARVVWLQEWKYDNNRRRREDRSHLNRSFYI